MLTIFDQIRLSLNVEFKQGEIGEEAYQKAMEVLETCETHITLNNIK